MPRTGRWWLGQPSQSLLPTPSPLLLCVSAAPPWLSPWGEDTAGEGRGWTTGKAQGQVNRQSSDLIIIYTISKVIIMNSETHKKCCVTVPLTYINIYSKIVYHIVIEKLNGQ